MLDLAVRDAVVYDGFSGEPVEADIGVTGGVICEIGTVGPARRELVAAGAAAAPGFIDAHSHDDMELHRHPDNRAKLRQGVTTVVCGNCGFSAFPHSPAADLWATSCSDFLSVCGPWNDCRGYRHALAEHGTGTNVAAFVGHNSILRSLRGPGPAPLSRLQRVAVLDEVRRAMDAGALGVSTGLIYEPGRHAGAEDLTALVAAVADYGGLHSTHLRDEASGLAGSVAEVLGIARETGAGVQISHLKAIGPSNWGTVGESLRLIEAAHADGVDVAFDVYPYTAGSGPLRAYFDPDDMDAARAALVQVIRCEDYPDYTGRRLVEVAEAEGLDLEELLRRIVTAPYAARTLCVIFEIDETDMVQVLTHPLAMIGSDGIPQDGGVPHPRLLGAFPRVLGHYSRDAGLLRLAEAIAKMTSVPAQRFGLRDRGVIAVGAAADIVVFDPGRIGDTGDYARRSDPAGVRYVVVNGSVAVTPEGCTGERSGRFLARARRESSTG